MSEKYILVGHKPVPVDDVLEWAKWFENADRLVKKTTVGDAKVSTVFLGLDHNFFGGEPTLFETMVFGGSLDQKIERYHTWEEAEAGHQCWVEKLQALKEQQLRKEQQLSECKHLNLYPDMNLQLKMANCGHFLIHGYWECKDCKKWIFIECEDEWDGRENVKSKDGKYQYQRIDDKNKIVNIIEQPER